MIHLSSSDVMEYYSSRPGTKLGLRIKGGQKYIYIYIFFFFFFLETPNRHLFRREMLCSQYFFTTFSQQFVSGRLLLVVMSGQKGNLSCGFKLEPITT